MDERIDCKSTTPMKSKSGYLLTNKNYRDWNEEEKSWSINEIQQSKVSYFTDREIWVAGKKN